MLIIKSIKPIVIIALIIIVFIVFTVLIHSASNQTILGADFYTFWTAGKALFIEHANPYSQMVTEQIQYGKLGRLAYPGEDQMAYAYPPYGLLAILPTVYLPFDWASALWLTINIFILFFLIFLLAPQVRSFLVTFFLFYPVFLNLILGTFDILALSGYIIFFVLLLSQERKAFAYQILSGALLAWSTVKPQFVWLVLGFCLLIAIRKKYLPFLISFGVSLTILITISFSLVPNWFILWVQQVRSYSRYVNSRPTITEFFMLVLPEKTSLYLSGIAFAILLFVAVYFVIRWWKGNYHWLKVVAWLSMLSFLFHLHGMAYEQIIFITPLILWINLRENWKSKEILLFWGGGILFSWLAFGFGLQTLAIDRSPVLFNLVWVVWLMRKQGFQL